jgi:hypothetical protein
VAKVRSVQPEAVVFRFARNDETPLEELLAIAQRQGVRLADDFLRENKPLVKKEELPPGDVAIHSAGTGYYSWGRFETVRRHVSRAGADEIDEATVRVPKGRMDPYLGLLSTFQTRYRLVRDGRGLSGGVSLREFVSRLSKKEVLTNKGKLTLNDLAAKGTDPRLILYSDPAISKHVPGGNDLMVFGDSDLLFEVAAFLTCYGVKFQTDTSGHEEFSKFGEPLRLYLHQFISDADYEKLGDSEVLYSVIHVVKAVKDHRLRDLFLNAARWSRSSEEVAKMRKHVLELDRQISKK